MNLQRQNGRHARKMKKNSLRWGVSGIAVVAMIFALAAFADIQPAKAVPLQVARHMGSETKLVQELPIAQLIEAEECQIVAKSVVETLVGKRPIYTRTYDEVGDKTVYLTIDDGPTAHTAELLDILAKYQVKATFFMLESAMAAHEAELKRMAADGHSMGMHGVTHRKEIVYASDDSVVQEMLTGQARIEALTGVTTTLFRPPYGSNPHMSTAYREAVLDAGLSMWDWNVDSLDWKFRSEHYVNHTMEQVERLSEKGKTPVILIHDTKETIKALPLLLEQLLEDGYEFVAIDGQTEPVQFNVPSAS